MITWGQLAKSQTDPEKIEEAIKRLINEHNADPEAHLVEGGSLKSHKMAEIIDHLVNSIVADKIKNLQISDLKFSDERFDYETIFLDHDKWTKNSQPAGSVIVYPGLVTLDPGPNVGSWAHFCLSSDAEGQTARFEKTPKFVSILDILDPQKCVAWFGLGDSPHAYIGFKVSNGKLYAGHGHLDVEYLTEISPTPDLNKKHHFMALLYSGQKIEYYIDQQLVAVHTENLPDKRDTESISYFLEFYIEVTSYGYPVMEIYFAKMSQYIQ
jgi:hypothetical protein